MKFREYELVSLAVEEASGFIANRILEYKDTLTKDLIIETVHEEIMHALCEIIEFDDLYAQDEVQQ